jgi:hypothetical protein
LVLWGKKALETYQRFVALSLMLLKESHRTPLMIAKDNEG